MGFNLLGAGHVRNLNHPGSRRSAITLLLVMAGTPLGAAVEPRGSTATEPDIPAQIFRHPRLEIGNHYLPANEARARWGSGVVAGLVALGVAPEHAYLDVRGGRWGTLMPTQPLLPGTGSGNDLSWRHLEMEAPRSRGDYQRSAWTAFSRYLEQHRTGLQLEASELTRPGHVTVHDEGRLVQIYAPRVVNGIPVRNSYLNATISHGNLILLGARNWGDVTVSPDPSITAETAIGLVSEHLGLAPDAVRWPKTSLAFVPLERHIDPFQGRPGEGYDYRLVWVLRPRLASEPLADWEALVDGHNGEILAFQDVANYASTREVVGGVYPISSDGVPPGGLEVTYPMAFTDVTYSGGTSFTDSGGNLLACVDGDITTTLTGPFVTITDGCGDLSETIAGDVLDLGTSDGTDCTVPPGASAGNTHAARTAFSAVNQAVAWAQGHLPDNPWLKLPLPVATNINSNCGATGGPGGLSFFTDGGGCTNSGEIAGVVIHEWGHGMDGSDATPNISSPGEGIADIYASLWLNTSCIGRGFRPGIPCGGYGDPCTTCNGVRDIDWANRASGVPHDIAFIDSCPPGNSNGPCGGSSHCEGAVYSEAVWDLWHRDLTAPPFDMSIETAREVTTRLTFVGAGAVGNWYNCVDGAGIGDGCNADGGYLNYLAADDDDGDLGNGTPHMSAIFAAFERHGIACPPPSRPECSTQPTLLACANSVNATGTLSSPTRTVSGSSK